MIQRIQTVWFFLAALVTASTLYFNMYKLADGNFLSLDNNYIGIVLVAVSVILSLVALFSFKKRPMQINLIWLNILVLIGLLVWIYFSIEDANSTNTAQGGSFRLAAFIPLVAIVFLWMARIGIKKDIKLLKAYDRLR